MEIIQLDPNQPQSKVIEKARLTLLKGGIIAYPTDTVYGLGAIISHADAVDRIKQIKGRPTHKPLSIMVRDIAMADQYGIVQPGIGRYLPGRYTVLLTKRDTVPAWITPNDFVGIRIPEHSFTRALMANLEEAVVTTSANASRRPAVHNISDLLNQVGERAGMIDVIVDAGQLPINPPSTLVNLKDEDR